MNVSLTLVWLRFVTLHNQRKHGWRHAKRPGVDEFLETLCQVQCRG